jgi:branched-chain amino acid transport system substrate-binding protein
MRRSRNRWLVLAAGIAVTAPTAAGCGTSSGGTAPQTILLGMTVPMTGDDSAYGPNMARAAQLAVDEINARGGVLGRQLRLQIEDDGCDPNRAEAAADRLAEARIVASVGGYCSSSTLPTMPIFAKADIPMVIPAANSDELVKEALPNAFLINGTGLQQANAAMKWITKMGATRVALVDDGSSYSRDIADLTAGQLIQPGQTGLGTATLAVRDSISSGQSDYTPTVNYVLSAKPDFVYWTGYYADGGVLVRQLRQAGYQGAVMVADGSVDPKLAEIAGGTLAEGTYATMTQTPDTIQGAGDWIARYRNAFGADPGPYSPQSYDAVRVVAEAVKDARSTEGKRIVAALEELAGFPLFSGPLRFTPEHTLSQGGFAILVLRNGRFQLADPLR